MRVRRAGALLHPTSLPGPHGIGDIGPSARQFLAWLESAQLCIWQVLPLNPVDGQGCPYACPSAFASEPLLLSIDDLVDDGLIRSHEKPYASGKGPVDWGRVRKEKGAALALAAERVTETVDVTTWADPELQDWALFRALSNEHGASWTTWPDPLKWRDADTLKEASDRLRPAILRELALQWLFDRQWGRLRQEARGRGIELWGDAPIFVGLPSADVWVAPQRWRLDSDGQPTVVSGVPPDAFSVHGQMWGHPLYNDAVHAEEGFAWWVRRFEKALSYVDRVRIDHFRGFAGVWEIPASATNAREGRWIPGAGRPLLEALQQAFPTMPFIAEDLGVITDDVTALREDYALPGMVILQFAFNGDPLAVMRHNHPYLPHNHHPNQVCYTGTHDNDTLLGWFRGTDEGTRAHLRAYLGTDDNVLPWSMLRAGWRSVCDTTIVPVQDLLGVGSEGRVNVPGKVEGNWAWRLPLDQLPLDLAARVAQEIVLSGRSRSARRR